MAKIITRTYGKLITAEDINTDWRSEYYNWPGLMVIGESDHKSPGKHFIYIYLNSPVHKFLLNSGIYINCIV